ncbi:MAG: L,D-transpeptidase [Akkermansiaceae bacterium]
MNLPEFRVAIQVSISDQTMKVTEGEITLYQAPISTAANGPGFEENSYKTPTGNFIIRERIGEGAPIRTLFKGRRPLSIWQGEDCEDGILTRILWLHGIDSENANTYSRYIYFHGTNAESEIGIPASHGCIRLRNRDMLQLFDLAPIGTRVQIS